MLFYLDVSSCQNCSILSELSNFVRIVQLCPNCPILSELSFFSRIVQLYPNCLSVSELSNYAQLSNLSELSNFVRIAQLCPNCPMKITINPYRSRVQIETFNLVFRDFSMFCLSFCSFGKYFYSIFECFFWSIVVCLPVVLPTKHFAQHPFAGRI